MLIKSQLRIKNSVLIIFVILITISVNNYSQDCKSKVQITTNDKDSRIYIDSLFVSKGNASIDLKKGNHILNILNSSLKWGQKNIYDTLKIIECSKNYFFNYDIKKSELTYAQPELYEYVNKNKSENFFSSTTFKILIGSAAVLGGVAAYFKIKADNKYDDYLQTKNRSTLDEVDRLDLYSGIAFGLLQINFGYLIYKFLTD